MITLSELKRATGFKTFTEFRKNIIHITRDNINPTHTNYVYNQPESHVKVKQFQATFFMSKRELEKAIQKESSVQAKYNK